MSEPTEIFVVDVDQLNMHSAPGGNQTGIAGRIAKKGERFPVLERKTVDDGKGLRVDWVKGKEYLRGFVWLAAENHRTKVKFGHFESIPAAMPSPPVVEQESNSLLKPVIVGAALVAAISLLAWCSLHP